MSNVLQQIGYALHSENLARKDEALDAAHVEIERLCKALQQILDGSRNKEVSNVEFRVKTAQAAHGALSLVECPKAQT